MGIDNIEAAINDDDPHTTFFVVAPNYAWFTSWCRERQINPHDKRKAIFVDEMKDVQGQDLNSEEQIVDLGSFDAKRYELVLALKNRVKP
jgi:hypothetical protein